MLWLVLVLSVAVLVAVLRGGRLTNLADIRVRWWWLLPLSFALQQGTRLLPDEPWTDTAGVAMVLSSYVPLVALVFVNRTRSGMWLSGIGVLLNFTVILLNGGMPVLTEAASVALRSTSPDIGNGYKHIALDATTRLPFLADVIPMRIAGSGTVLSLGDVFLAVGLAGFLEAELRRPVRWFKPGVKLSGGSASGR
jgi:peptidoglycan/LPS O-acetylase OafA/YrhL